MGLWDECRHLVMSIQGSWAANEHPELSSRTNIIAPSLIWQLP